VSLFLTRAGLRRDAATAAIRPLLVSDDPDKSIAIGHRLVWSLFADGPGRTRDFLWREEGEGRFMILSARAPSDPHGLFELATQEFAPSLAAGDRLRFVLRANATKAAKPAGEGTRGERIDVVMAALKGIEKGSERADARPALAEAEGRSWLAAAGARSGFSLEGDGPLVRGYRVVRLPRESRRNGKGKAGEVTLGVLDFDGVLAVTDPARFTDALAAGFGRAKSFGCGLMLIRRARD
jgi:CRISPR system Cascade subunit CasE